MHEMDADRNTDAAAAVMPYEVPAVETRTSVRDPLVWTGTSPICL